MNYFKYILLPLSLLLLLATACSDDEEKGGAGSSELSLTLNIPGAQLSKADPGEDPHVKTGERLITNVYLLFYPADAADTDLPTLFYRETGISNETTWKHTFSATAMSGLEAGTVYNVYALASLPAGTKAPTGQTTLQELMNLREKQFARTEAAPALSFSGTATNTGASKQPLAIDLVRTVARIDITFTGAPATADIAIEIQNSPVYTYYQPGKTTTTDDRKTEKPIKIDDSTFRYYVYENLADDQAIRIYTKAVSSENSEEFVYLADVNSKGNYEIKRNYIYSVGMTFKPEGTLDVTCNAIPWEAEIEVPVIPEYGFIQPKANAYIVAPGGEAIYIPVAQANEANRVNSAIPAIGDTEKLTAELVWTDALGTGDTPGLASDASVAEIAVIGSGAEATLKVTPGSKHGNSVVAVKGEDGTVKWSWHIWVTDYDPDKPATATEPGYGSYVMGGDVFMDRNLGAITATPNNEGAGIVGNFYQWGRKDPFPTVKNGVVVPVYNAAGTQVTKATNTPSNIPALVKEPYGWTTAITYFSPQLWGNNGDGTNSIIGDKTVYDPCPAGWRVPRMDAYLDLKHANFPVTTATTWKGREGNRTGFFPKTGVVGPTGAYSENGYIFMCTSLRGYRWGVIATGAAAEPLRQANDAAFGFAVRCVKDFKKRPDNDNEVRIMHYAATTQLLSLTYRLDAVDMPLNANTQAGIQGLREFLTEEFSPEKPVNATFRFYNTAAPANLIDNLKKYDINVLHLYYQGGVPNAALSQNILTWLAEDKHRVLILDADGSNQAELANAMGLGALGTALGTSVPNLSPAAKNDAPIYNKIANGPYGKISGNNIPAVNGGAAVVKSTAEAAGFVPIFYNAKNLNQVLVAVHPEKRMVYWNDSQYFSLTSASGPYNVFGKLNNPKAHADYPIWGANLWTWIVNQALGTNYE